MHPDPARLFLGTHLAGLKEPAKEPVLLLVLNTRKTGLLLWSLLCVGCGSDSGRPPPARSDSELPDLSAYDSSTADSRDVWARGSCEAGTIKECRVYLPAHDGIQPCFVGVQKCVDGQWGRCDEAELVDANAGDSALDPDDATPAP